MNQALNENNITAILDTRDGDAYRKHMKAMIPADVPTLCMNMVNDKLRNAGIPAEAFLGDEMHEALTIVASFLEPGRQRDMHPEKGSIISNEALRASSMMIAAIIYMASIDVRVVRETFMKYVNEPQSKDMDNTERLVSWTMFLSQEHADLKKRIGMIETIIHSVTNNVLATVVHNGLRDQSEKVARDKL